jgi:hypothetical protein
MTASYRNPFYQKPHMGLPARAGFGYDAPVAIQAQCIYYAEICVRIQNEWYVQDDGFIEITNKELLTVLERWYEAQL